MVMRDRWPRVVHLGHGQAVDVIAAPGKQPDDPRQNARFVFDQHRQRVPFDHCRNSWGAGHRRNGWWRLF